MADVNLNSSAKMADKQFSTKPLDLLFISVLFYRFSGPRPGLREDDLILFSGIDRAGRLGNERRDRRGINFKKNPARLADRRRNYRLYNINDSLDQH